MIANEPDCFGNFFPDPNCYACLCHEECEEAKQQDLIDKSNFKNEEELVMTVDALRQLVDFRNRLKEFAREASEMQDPLPEDISSALGMIVDADFVLWRAVKRLIADYDAHAIEIGYRQ